MNETEKQALIEESKRRAKENREAVVTARDTVLELLADPEASTLELMNAARKLRETGQADWAFPTSVGMTLYLALARRIDAMVVRDAIREAKHALT
ncbi:MAG: hypothetical protein OXJ55_07995 [Caldilineaceae bacterium]|nr:hypothetical protein [Caldilineaceae bacterium]